MKSATTPALPETPPGDVTAGIDWASDDHAVCILDGRGREIARAVVEHTSTGLRELTRLLTRHGACEVAIERPDGPVVEALLDAEVTVVVISPNRVKNLRGRYGSAGNKDDRFDAFVLADTLRTDRARLRPLIPDAPDSVALRRACRTRKDLVGHRVATANQLRAHLHDVLLRDQPGLPDPVRHPGPRRLAHPDPTGQVAGLGRLQRTHPPRHAARPPDRCAPRPDRARRARRGRQHPRAHRRTDDPDRADQEARDPDQRPARRARRRAHLHLPPRLAGVAPSTRQSGKMRAVGFRWACDKQLRDAVTDFAGDSRHANPWAADLYDRARARGHDHPHAVRIPGRAWLNVIWHLWQGHTAYDPTKHHALQRLLTNPTQEAPAAAG